MMIKTLFFGWFLIWVISRASLRMCGMSTNIARKTSGWIREHNQEAFRLHAKQLEGLISPEHHELLAVSTSVPEFMCAMNHIRNTSAIVVIGPNTSLMHILDSLEIKITRNSFLVKLNFINN